MSQLPAISFSHVGVYVKDMEKMVAFYQRLLGLVVTDRGPLRDGEIVFLSRDTIDHHQIALVSGRTSEETTVNQLAFRLGSLGDLRRMRDLVAADVDAGDCVAITHGNAWSIYFPDPEGNRIEFFVDSPFYVQQPQGRAFDLSLSDDEIQASTREQFAGEPGFKPVEEWRAEFAQRLAE